MGELHLTRREFAKTAAVTAAAAAFAASAPHALAQGSEQASATPPVAKTAMEILGIPNDGQEHKVRSCCRGCGKMECGVYVVVKDGRAIRVEGDEGSLQSMGNCCTKSQSSVQAAYHPDRLMYPMKRTNPKGSADPGWVRISWDEAIETVVSKFKEIQEQYGGEAIACSVGTSRFWCMHSESVIKGLFQTPNNIEAWQICKGPRHLATQMCSVFALSWMETVTRPRVFVSWGGSSELSNYDDSCRTTVDVAVRADSFIKVDPRMSNLGKEADYWQHLRTGTDGALAWTNVIIENGLIDELYTKKWTNAPFLVCEDIEPSGFVAYRNDGSEYELKTHLLKESDVVEGGSPYKFLVHDANWEQLAADGIEHQYGEFTWFNSYQWGVIDNTGGFWEGENYDSRKAREGREANQPNLVKGQIQGHVPDLLPFDPGIDPDLYGEFTITLKDGKEHTVRPVFDYYRELCSHYSPEVAAEITGIPAEEIVAAATVYGTRVDPESGYGNGGIQYMLAIEHACNAVQNSRALDVLVGITGNIDVPGGNRSATIVPIDGDQLGFTAWVPGAAVPTRDVTEKLLGSQDISLLYWWGSWADMNAAFTAMLSGDPYPVRALWNESGNFMCGCNTSFAWAALNSLDFMVDLNLWHAPSTDAADILLPSAHWIEVSSPRASQGSAGGMGATVKCVEPPCEAKYDPEIVMSVYREWGMPWNLEEGNEWPDINWQLDDSIKLFSDDEYIKQYSSNQEIWPLFGLLRPIGFLISRVSCHLAFRTS